ncbi:hypothetical protein GCM10009557_52760 [Virgisporangium ochraceum]
MRAEAVPSTRFRELGWPYLLGEPVLNNLILTVVDGRPPDADDRFWLVSEGGTAGGAAGGTAGGAVCGAAVWAGLGLLLAGRTREVAEALADAQDVPVPQVTGEVDPAAWFDARYRERTGVPVEVGMPSRIFEADRIVAPHGVSGRARQATPADRDRVLRWADAFADEALPGERRGDHADHVDSRLGRDGRLWLWEDGGRPVTMVMVSRPVAGVVRISWVYTPPDQRRRGYASACTAAASAYALSSVATTCTLYTDLRNATTNRIYPAIGYRPVADVMTWRYST